MSEKTENTGGPLCPFIRTKEGKLAQCGAYCSLFVPNEDPKYEGCAITRAAWGINGIQYLLRNPGKGGKKNTTAAPEL